MSNLKIYVTLLGFYLPTGIVWLSSNNLTWTIVAAISTNIALVLGIRGIAVLENRILKQDQDIQESVEVTKLLRYEYARCLEVAEKWEKVAEMRRHVPLPEKYSL